MPVRDIARSNVVTISPDASLSAVVEVMGEKSVGSVVVVSEDGPERIVSDRDLAFAVLGGEYDPEETRVADIKTDELVTVDANTGIYDVVEEMSEHGVRRVPVTDGDELVGIVSLSDIIVLLGMELQHVANTIRTVSPAYERLATELYD
jgi:CBS domain-containing protein